MPVVSLCSFRRIRLQGLAALIVGPAVLLLTPGRAEAILIYNIFDSGSNNVKASGSLTLPTTPSTPAIFPLHP